MQARGRWALRDRPSVAWLAAAILMALSHRALADSRWIMVHLTMLGAITHSITVWSAQFASTWAKSDHPQLSRPAQNRRLILLNGGALGVIVTVPLPWTWAWWLTVVFATLVGTAVLWHVVTLTLALRGALSNRWKTAIAHYVLGGTFLLAGITCGVLLAHRPADPWRGQLLVAHTMFNVLGWVGCSILGTIVTLWPTVLRTKMPQRAMRLSALTLLFLTVGVTLAATGALADCASVTVLGLAVYVAAILLTWVGMVAAFRTSKHRGGFAMWSMAAGQVWLAASVIALALAVATQPSWGATGTSYGRYTSMFVVGFAVQTLIGAMSHLVPAVLGGGPKIVKATMPHFDRWATARLILTNPGLFICVALDVTWVRAVTSVLVLAALASFVPLMMMAIKAAVRIRKMMVAQRAAGTIDLTTHLTTHPVTTPAEPRRNEDGRAPQHEGQHERQQSSAIQALAAVMALMVAVGVGVWIDPLAAGFGGKMQTVVPATGHTTRVTVTAKDMRFTPSTITVPRGDRLVLTVKNADAQNAHDLVLDSGATSGRLAPGASGTVDAGVIGESMSGWCSIVGHRQMGMTLAIQVSGASGSTGHDMGSMPGMTMPEMPKSNATGLDMMRPWASSFTARDPKLPALTSERHHRMTLTVTEKNVEVAPGVVQQRWMFNGQAPGPTLHGRVGDTFEITLVNAGTMGHSIDFHAGELAPDQPMRTIKPGERLTYTFTARRAGIWMYHCSTMPMSAHIAAGMAGAVVIEPDGLAPLPSYLMTQSELYLGQNGGALDAAKLAAQTPDAVVFNGLIRQYDDRPIQVAKGKKFRVWVLDVGPNRPSSFHVVGAQFSTTYLEGAYQLRDGRDAFGQSGNGSQALGLQPAQGGFVELTLPEAGHYPFVSHIMSDAEKGAHGVFEAK